VTRAGRWELHKECLVYVKGPNLHLAGDKLFGGIGFINKEDSTRKGGTVQVRTSERIIRAE
jgi:hypothetical protein